MRKLLFFVVLLASAARAAEPPDGLDGVQRLAAAGAAQLALTRLERSQPGDAASPRWAEWEVLRFKLLWQLNRHSELLARASGLPAAMPATPLVECLTLAVRAAVSVAQSASARRHAARLLWRLNPPADAVRELRRLVIESYVIENKGDEAFRSMLRFQQDYQPLERAVATRFAEWLLALGMEKDAVNWLAGLDDLSPVKLMLQLRTGLVSTDGAIAQARAQLGKGSDIGYWRVMAEAASRQRNPALQLEAAEQILRLTEAGKPQPIASLARQLWQLYVAAAQDAGNQNQLLAGDDANWSDFAARRLGTNPLLSRAFFAYLAQRGQTPEMRHHAQLQLAFSLYTSGLDLVALRLFHDESADVGTFDNQARYLLGTIAESHNQPAVALRFWHGLGTPPDIGPDEWALKVAGVALRSGNPDAATAALKQAIAGKKTLPGELAQRSVLLAQDMLDAGKLDLADAMFGALLPLADGMQQRQILFGLGRVNEVDGKSPVAAEYYMRSALLADGRQPDALALQARLAAALNLARAGYRNDARAQFEWVLANSKDPVQLETARRELRKL